ncbi:hypothetical protein [Nannocystis pusilla]|uniref:Methanolan biosynthesis EpsI domain-containing protein n=1 Tax=Nannocystis pusilla TaxID=889268 RepID=A0ABS7U2E5_9BACT|nr:hypothetical protein [Nannocystis pusilla]MBZ5714520.1 hypothetical protein [Nannocystis pusilla]
MLTTPTSDAPRSAIAAGTALVLLALVIGLDVACAGVAARDPYTALMRGHPEEAGGCTLALSDVQSPLLEIQGRVNLPRGVLLIDETLDFYKDSEVARLVGSPCRTYAIYGWFNVIDPVGPDDHRDGIVYSALGLPPDHVRWSEVTMTPTRFSGAYEYRDWYPRPVPPRKGWATLRVLRGVAYYFVLETNQDYWDSLGEIFKRSAETAVFTAARGQGPSALDDEAALAADAAESAG